MSEAGHLPRSVKPADRVGPVPADLDLILEHTRQLWDDVRGKRLFVTGGTGFFGRWLLESFVSANAVLGLEAEAVVLSRDPEAFRRRAPLLVADGALSLVRGDVRDFEPPPGRFEYVVHAAADSVVLDGEAANGRFDTIVEGTRRVLDFAARSGTGRLLYISSGAVYGPQPAGMTHVPESYGGGPDPLAPLADYAEGKRAAETLCALASRSGGPAVTIARCFAFVGPHLPLDAHYAIGNFVRDAVAGGPVRVLGDGTPWRSYLYAADLAIWLWTILFRGEDCRAYNVGSEAARPLREWAGLVAELVSPAAEVDVSGTPEVGRAGGERYVPSTARARAELGLGEVTDQRTALERTVLAARRRADLTEVET